MFESITKVNYETALARVLERMEAEPGTTGREEPDGPAAVIDASGLNQIMNHLRAKVVRRCIN